MTVPPDLLFGVTGLNPPPSLPQLPQQESPQPSRHASPKAVVAVIVAGRVRVCAGALFGGQAALSNHNELTTLYHQRKRNVARDRPPRRRKKKKKKKRQPPKRAVVFLSLAATS